MGALGAAIGIYAIVVMILAATMAAFAQRRVMVEQQKLRLPRIKTLPAPQILLGLDSL